MEASSFLDLASGPSVPSLSLASLLITVMTLGSIAALEADVASELLEVEVVVSAPAFVAAIEVVAEVSDEAPSSLCLIIAALAAGKNIPNIFYLF